MIIREVSFPLRFREIANQATEGRFGASPSLWCQGHHGPRAYRTRLPLGQRGARWYLRIMRWLVLGAVLSLAGCGWDSCDGVDCNSFVCREFVVVAKDLGPKCSCASPPFCCETCDGDEGCLDYCVDEEP